MRGVFAIGDATGEPMLANGPRRRRDDGGDRRRPPPCLGPAAGPGVCSTDPDNFLIAEPIHAAAIYRSGVLVQVPRPKRYAIHKLIIADRRRDGAGGLKAPKDRDQAAFLVGALAEDRPDDLRLAYATAMDVGPRWREHIANSLKRMPDTMNTLNRL
jgi:hypothetical protein